MLTALVLLLIQDDLTVLKPEEQPRKMLYKYLEAECGKKFDERRKTVAALKTEADVRKRQDELRAKFIEAIGGYPERTPLNAKVVGTVKGDGFRVEKVIYESRPDHHVTANLYLPDGKGPFPGVLLPCGHSDAGKAEKVYQSACILMAKNGLAVLSYDPIGQGERMQLLTPEGKPAIKGNTTEHTMVEVGALLVGWSTASFRIWDGLRSIDYLCSRPEIDPKKIGCTGNSGGGTMTAYLMALDDRIACAAPSCYVTTLERLFATIGPQDGEQNITGQVAFGMEQTDYVTMRAPKPTLMCVATQDFFDIQGAWTTFREAKQIYGVLGHPERMDLIEYNDKHGFSKPRREAAMRWMRRWLLGIDDAPVEVESPTFKEQDLWCTPSGQVLADLKGKSVFDLIAARARELAGKRKDLPRDELVRVVRAKAGLQNVGSPAVSRKGAAVDGRERLIKYAYDAGPGIVLPALSRRTGNNIVHSLLGVGGEGKATFPVEDWVAKGFDVVAIDLRGLGELAPDAKDAAFGPDWKEAFLSLHLNRPLLGQRVRDLLAVATDVIEIKGNTLVATGAAGPIALHAALLEDFHPTIVIEGSILSWTDVATAGRTRNQLANAVPGALEAYDLPDLAAALAPRRLTIRNPVDPMGKPVTQADLEKAYKKVREAYAAAGAAEGLVLEVKP